MNETYSPGTWNDPNLTIEGAYALGCKDAREAAEAGKDLECMTWDDEAQQHLNVHYADGLNDTFKAFVLAVAPNARAVKNRTWSIVVDPVYVLSEEEDCEDLAWERAAIFVGRQLKARKFGET